MGTEHIQAADRNTDTRRTSALPALLFCALDAHVTYNHAAAQQSPAGAVRIEHPSGRRSVLHTLVLEGKWAGRRI
ncbi:hypothetical protein GCM10010350_64900 [Streptomyces galilaeus]|nr:hypothetical protein GCM10010350_64900 [Streptomyces galilaeus]